MTPRGEPDPRQLRMESLQAMSEAARRADAAGAPRPPPRGPRPPLRRVHGDVATAPHIHGAYIPPPPAEAAEQPPRSLSVCSGHSGDGYSTGDGDSSPRSPFTPTRPTSISVISELDTIQSEVWSPSEEPSSPHSPSPISVTNLLDDSAPRAPRKLDHYYAAPTRSTSCCVVA